jgi:hypothetical protein
MIKHNVEKVLSIFSVSILLGILFDYFFFDKGLGIAFPLYILLVVFGLFGISYVYRKKINKGALLLLIPLFFFSVMTAVRSSELLTFLNIVACIYLLLLIADLCFDKKISNYLIRDYVVVPFTPFKFINPFFKSILDLFSLRKESKDKKVSSQIVRGILISIPFLIIFIILFSSADLVFQKYMSDLVSINIKGETIVRIFLVLLVSCVFVGAYSYIFNGRKEVISDKERRLSIGEIESYILLGSVNLLFLLFISVQITYLFGGQSNISSLGFTYAQYARRGFFELIGVAVISFFLLLGLDKYIKREKGNNLRIFKVLSSFLVAEVVVIMISAFTRLLLYEDAYGFTTLRLYSHIFIIFLTVIFALLIYKVLKNEKESNFSLGVFLCSILFLVGMNILNPDAFIAQRNIERFNDGKKIDVYYLTTLSDDALPVTIKMLNVSDESIKGEFAYYMYWRVQGRDSSSNWQSFNISRNRAQEIIDSKIEVLEEYREYIKEFEYD